MSGEKKEKLVFFQVDQDAKLGKHLAQVSKTALASAWKELGEPEAHSPQPSNVVQVFQVGVNLFAQAVHTAFYEHFPLILSPDIIWLTIAQGLANHVSQDPEGLRKHFVDFDGKKEITVERLKWEKGSSDKDWSSLFPEFSAAIARSIGTKAVDLLTCDFSTSTAVERIVSQICIMDTVKHYFTYVLRGGCGIPSIALRGTADDWAKVKAKAEQLKQYGLDWWLQELLPVLDQFVAAAKGKPDAQFWRSICNFSGMSGALGEPITGWLQVFFPYLNACGPRGCPALASDLRLRSNRDYIGEYRKAYESGATAATNKKALARGRGVKLEDFPPALCRAPFLYEDLPSKKTCAMCFLGGITSLVQHPRTRALEPVMGWAVVGSPEKLP